MGKEQVMLELLNIPPMRVYQWAKTIAQTETISQIRAND
jgi:hypothetical protein